MFWGPKSESVSVSIHYVVSSSNSCLVNVRVFAIWIFGFPAWVGFISVGWGSREVTNWIWPSASLKLSAGGSRWTSHSSPLQSFRVSDYTVVKVHLRFHVSQQDDEPPGSQTLEVFVTFEISFHRYFARTAIEVKPGLFSTQTLSPIGLVCTT